MTKLRIADDCQLDLLKLVDSRALIQANSGGGKSWLLRLIAEQAAGHVQVVILDPEGEFATLRERFDFLLVGQGGEIPAETRSAGLLARKLMELEASAVIDLYDLRLPDRRRFVRLFLESLMNLPKPLWRPLLVMLDEAHLFCPERSSGDAESTAAVIDLMSQGRKRSYCGILATQRLSKLHKDAEAETNNVFVGRTWLDIDQERAGKLLGFSVARRQEMRDLAPGEFFTFGPALSAQGVAKFRAGQAQTTHPKAGQRHKLNPPKPSEAVRRIVADLADLPQQAEAEVRDLADAKKKIAELQRELRARTEQQTIEVEKVVERHVLKNGQLDRAHALVDRLDKIATPIREAIGRVSIVPTPLPKPIVARSVVAARPPMAPRPAVAKPPVPNIPGNILAADCGDLILSKVQQRILDALAWYESLGTPEPSNVQVGAVALIDTTGGYFSNVVGPLSTAGLVDRLTGGLRLTDAGRAIAKVPEEAASLGQYHDVLRSRVRKMKSASGKTIDILNAIIDASGAELTAEQIGQAVSIDHTGGYFSNCIGPLGTAGLIERDRGVVKPTSVLFPPALPFG